MNPKKTRVNKWLQDQQKFSLFLQLSTDDPSVKGWKLKAEISPKIRATFAGDNGIVANLS